MPWVKTINPYFSGPLFWRARWPLRRVLRYVATFTVGAIAGAAFTPARFGEPDGVVAVSRAVPGIDRVRRAAMDMPVAHVAKVASARQLDRADTAVSNGEGRADRARKARGGDE